MLWKLADNVKYEDDCEVSIERGQRVSGGGLWPLRGAVENVYFSILAY